MGIAIPNPKSCVVKPGENLTLIASRHGFKTWESVYYAGCNKNLRLKRPSPNMIQPGDVVCIPWKLSEVRTHLQDRKAKLENLRKQANDMYTDQLKDLEGAFKQANKTGSAVDLTKSLIDIGSALTGAAKAASRTLGKEGEELEKLNKEFFEKVQHVRKETRSAILKDPMGEYAKEHMPGHGLLWALGQTAIDTFLKFDSPSFWAWTFTQLRIGKSWGESVTSSPDQLFEESKSRLLRAKNQALSNIDGRIRELDVLLNEARAPRLH